MGLRVISADGGAGRLMQDNKTVVYAFAIVDGSADADEAVDGAADDEDALHRFEARYSQLKSLHDALHDRSVFTTYDVPHSGGMFSSTFPPPYHMKDMRTPENREIRAGELASYLSTLLLSHPGIWEQDEVRTALDADPSTAVTISTAIHQEMGGISGDASAGADAVVSAGAERNIPAHFRGRWLHDERSDGLEPLVEATGVGWLGHKVGQETDPAIEIFFTETHLVVIEGDEEPVLDDRQAAQEESAVGAMMGESEGCVRGKVTQFLLSGEEDVYTRIANGEEEKVSTKYWSNGELTKTWTWLWHPNGKRKSWAIISERQVEGKSVLYAPSFSEHVCFLPLDNPTVPVVTLERYMSRDSQHTPRAMPGALQARTWRPEKRAGAGASGGSSPSTPAPVVKEEQTVARAKSQYSATVNGEPLVGKSRSEVADMLSQEELAEEARSKRVASLNERVQTQQQRQTQQQALPPPKLRPKLRPKQTQPEGSADSLAVRQLREKDALLTARHAEMLQVEQAEAEKAALLAETLKRAAALQEQIQKITAAAAGADRGYLSPQQEQRPSTAGAASDGYGFSPPRNAPTRARPSSAASTAMRSPSGARISATYAMLAVISPTFLSVSSASASANISLTECRRVCFSRPRATGDGRKRRARQPLEMLEHGDLGCTTEWWQPGSEGGPDARLEDVLGRAALASGDPKGTLEKLIVNSKLHHLKDELDGMGEKELEDKARDLGITVLDILKAEAADSGYTEEEIAAAILAGETDPNSTPEEELKKLIRKGRQHKLDAEKRDLEVMANTLGISVEKLIEMEAAQKGFCLGDVQVKACLEGVDEEDESMWLSAATGLTPRVPMSGPTPPATSKRPSPPNVVDGTTDALLSRVLDLQHVHVDSVKPWVEEWHLGGSTTKMRDQDGEELVHQLVAALRTDGTMFTDASFPPTEASLSRSESGFPVGAEGVEWKRPGDIGHIPGQDVTTIVAFSDDLAPEDVAQGKLGDCYFLAALASLASAADDHLLKDLIIEDGQDVGLFGVKFFVSGCWVTVVVDDWFPCVQDESGAWRPIFASSKNHPGSPETQIELCTHPSSLPQSSSCKCSVVTNCDVMAAE
jgi:hypothetical protein